MMYICMCMCTAGCAGPGGLPGCSQRRHPPVLGAAAPWLGRLLCCYDSCLRVRAGAAGATGQRAKLHTEEAEAGAGCWQEGMRCTGMLGIIGIWLAGCCMAVVDVQVVVSDEASCAGIGWTEGSKCCSTYRETGRDVNIPTLPFAIL